VSTIADPGVYLLVAMVACVHATVVLSRRYAGSFKAHYLFYGLAAVLASSFLFLPVFVNPGPGAVPASPWVWAVPLVCSFALAPRTRSAAASAAVFVAGAGIGFAFFSFALFLTPPLEQQTRRFGPLVIHPAPATQYETAFRVVKGLPGPVSPGFIDPNTSPALQEVTYDRPVQRWHTPITGVPGREIFRYRVWTPGGNPDVAAKNLRLVREGESEPRWNLAIGAGTTVSLRP
jgi:hypothetical protein